MKKKGDNIRIKINEIRTGTIDRPPKKPKDDSFKELTKQINLGRLIKKKKSSIK